MQWFLGFVTALCLGVVLLVVEYCSPWFARRAAQDSAGDPQSRQRDERPRGEEREREDKEEWKRREMRNKEKRERNVARGRAHTEKRGCWVVDTLLGKE